MENDIIFKPLEFRNLTVKNRIFRSSISGRWDNYDGSGTQARIKRRNFLGETREYPCRLYLIIPQTKKALLQQKEDFAWMDSRPNWGSGRIDPFNPVKFNTLKLPKDHTIGNSDMMPIWNQKMHKNFALHWDGLETS